MHPVFVAASPRDYVQDFHVAALMHAIAHPVLSRSFLSSVHGQCSDYKDGS
jgi:hypothetical protein